MKEDKIVIPKMIKADVSSCGVIVCDFFECNIDNDCTLCALNSSKNFKKYRDQNKIDKDNE